MKTSPFLLLGKNALCRQISFAHAGLKIISSADTVNIKGFTYYVKIRYHLGLHGLAVNFFERYASPGHISLVHRYRFCNTDLQVFYLAQEPLTVILRKSLGIDIR